MILKTKLLGHVYQFQSVKDVLAKANDVKSGDSLAGIAAESAEERVAAKVVVANLTLADLRNHPASQPGAYRRDDRGGSQAYEQYGPDLRG